MIIGLDQAVFHVMISNNSSKIFRIRPARNNDTVAQIRHLLLCVRAWKWLRQFPSACVMPVLFLTIEVGITPVTSPPFFRTASAASASVRCFRHRLSDGYVVWQTGGRVFRLLQNIRGYLSAGCAVYAYGMYLIHCLCKFTGWMGTKYKVIYIKMNVQFMSKWR